jgi:hypothetical protein
MAKLRNSTQLVLMPTSSAATRLYDVASMALPCRVRLKKYHKRHHHNRRDPQHPQALWHQRGTQNLQRGVAGKRGRLKVPLPSQT